MSINIVQCDFHFYLVSIDNDWWTHFLILIYDSQIMHMIWPILHSCRILTMVRFRIRVSFQLQLLKIGSPEERIRRIIRRSIELNHHLIQPSPSIIVQEDNPTHIGLVPRFVFCLRTRRTRPTAFPLGIALSFLHISTVLRPSTTAYPHHGYRVVSLAPWFGLFLSGLTRWGDCPSLSLPGGRWDRDREWEGER